MSVLLWLTVGGAILVAAGVLLLVFGLCRAAGDASRRERQRTYADELWDVFEERR